MFYSFEESDVVCSNMELNLRSSFAEHRTIYWVVFQGISLFWTAIHRLHSNETMTCCIGERSNETVTFGYTAAISAKPSKRVRLWRGGYI